MPIISVRDNENNWWKRNAKAKQKTKKNQDWKEQGFELNLEIAYYQLF